MLRFVDRFYRDRALLLVIAALALALSLGVVVAQPRVYEATARVWVDTTVEGDHPNAYVSPSDVGTQILGELLKTRSFALRVGDRSRLSGDVTVPRGGGQDRGDAVLQLLTRSVVVTEAGPNVIGVAVRHRDPGLAAATAQAIVDLFRAQVLGGQVDRATATVAFYEKQVASAQSDLAAADGRINDYVASSPLPDLPPPATVTVPADASASQPAVPQDVTLMALQRQDDAARKRSDDLGAKLDQARLDLTVLQQSTPSGVRLVDRPLPPRTPVSRMKPLLVAGAGGLAAGLLLSFLALTALTAADTSIRFASEVEPALGLRLAGSIPHIAPWR
jgi:uncharacterized protein involved in exopolysaccharide biosynthesis